MIPNKEYLEIWFHHPASGGVHLRSIPVESSISRCMGSQKVLLRLILVENFHCFVQLTNFFEQLLLCRPSIVERLLRRSLKWQYVRAILLRMKCVIRKLSLLFVPRRTSDVVQAPSEHHPKSTHT